MWHVFYSETHFTIDLSNRLYDLLFLPFLRYGILVWGLTYETHITPVFLLQKRVLRAISFKHSTSPSTLLFSNLKILKLQDLFHFKLLIFVYECVNKIFPTYFHSFFDLVESVHQYGTREATRNNIFLTHKTTMQYGIRSLLIFVET